ncbi:MAG: hypothetical protein D6725_06560 [Planctomycetota bacterium]|nr:MAG: hypothetical protein D6725_06560 [Planctomycetota bacterium]
MIFLKSEPEPDNPFVEQMREYTIDELVRAFNHQVRSHGFVRARGQHAHALYCELRRRGIDISEVSPEPLAIRFWQFVEYDPVEHKLRIVPDDPAPPEPDPRIRRT